MREKLLEIIEHFGVIHQLKYFQSEVFELNEAILTKEIDYKSSDITISIDKANLEHIIEELADVLVMLNQFRLYYGISREELEKHFNYKVDRTIKRIKEGYYEKEEK